MTKRIRQIVDKILEVGLIVILGFMVLNVVFQVFSRYVLANPSSVTEELARFLMIWLGLLGSAYATGKHLHIAIDLLSNRLGSKGRQVKEVLVTSLVMLFALGCMVIGGIRLVAITLETEQVSAVMQIPLGYIYLALPISGILIMLYALLNLLDYNPEEQAGNMPPETSS